jgi:hypothetical protein
VSAYPIGNIKGIHPVRQLCSFIKQVVRTPCILQSPGFGDHSVLLYNSPSQVVDVSRIVDLPCQCSRLIGSLLSSEDMEVIISRMSSSVSLGADGGSKDDQVSVNQLLGILCSSWDDLLGDRGMNDVHASHSPSSIVENPFRRIPEIHLEASIGVGSSQLLEKSGNDSGSIIRLGSMLL